MIRHKMTIRQRVLALLADGKPRRSDEIRGAMQEHGFSAASVCTALAFFANHRFIERTKDGALLVYRRLDVERVA